MSSPIVIDANELLYLNEPEIIVNRAEKELLIFADHKIYVCELPDGFGKVVLSIRSGRGAFLKQKRETVNKYKYRKKDV